MIPYDFHPEAKAEFIEATVFYESRRVGLGNSFAAEVEHTIALIRSHPDVMGDVMGDVVMGDVGSKTLFAFGDAGASARSWWAARGGAHGFLLLPRPSADSRGIPLATSWGSATIR